jgi:hypothetical protein
MTLRSDPYLSKRLAYPLPIKSGAVLLTLQDARDYILMLEAQLKLATGNMCMG